MNPSTTVTELAFEVTDSTYPFVEASQGGDVECQLRSVLPQSDGSYVEFFEVVGDSPDPMISAAEEYEDVDARPLVAEDDEGVVAIEVEDPSECVAATLADEDAILQTVAASEGSARVEAAVPEPCDTNDLVEAFTEEHPSADLLAKRERPFSEIEALDEGVDRAIEDDLTDRQREVLVTAYLSGYFERPRETTAAELADRLGISSSTFAQHLRVAQRKVFDSLFDEGVLAAPTRIETD